MQKQRMLIGVMDGNIGGLNRFITDYIVTHKNEYDFLILSGSDIQEIYLKEISSVIETTIKIIPKVTNPRKLFITTLNSIREFKPHILYLNISTNLFVPILIAAEKENVPERIVHSHSSWTQESKKIKKILIILLNVLLRKTVREKATQHFACSEKAAQWMFGSGKKFEFINNKIRESKFLFSEIKRHEIRNSLGIVDELCIGFVGGFSPPKKIPYFFALAKELSKYRDDFVIVMIGDGVERMAFETKVQKSKYQDKFIFTGNLQNAFEYYNAFDCFVLPSRFEGLPIVGVEAQVNGLPTYFSNSITKMAKILEETVYFDNRNGKSLARILANASSRIPCFGTKLENYKEFIF